MRRRTFLHTASVLGLAPFMPIRWGRTTQPMFIDADTANEIDDLFAIVRALRAPMFDVVAVSSAQWNHRLSPPNTVELSQELNEDILRIMGRDDIPMPRGAEMIMGKPWGGEEPRNSPAARLMIRMAKAMPDGERLDIVTLGAATNVASAIKMAPEIIGKIRCHHLGGRYFPDRNVWDKDEFNLRNDLNAINYLFNTEGVEIHLMPINTLFDFKVRLDESIERLTGTSPINDYLAAKWLSHDPSSAERILWDLALIQAMIHPDKAETQRVMTPPENTQRELTVYTKIDEAAFLADLWETLGV
ncbi:MAG: nucleoside hydrolase [Bacteroidota bacterium]